jgi:hypothetical protein
MVYVPAGKFIFGEDETRELASFAWKLDLAGI